MARKKKVLPKVRDYLEESDKVVKKYFEMHPGNTNLHILGKKDKKHDFLECELEKYNLQILEEQKSLSQYHFVDPRKDVLGMYIARKQRAFVPEENVSELFRVHYGSMFFDYFSVGKEIIKLENRLLDEERRYFKDNPKITLQDVKDFRYGKVKKINLSQKELLEFMRDHPEESYKLASIGNATSINLENLRFYYASKYGLFTVFMEKLLSDKIDPDNEFGLKAKFEERYSMKSEPIRTILNHVEDQGFTNTIIAFKRDLNNVRPLEVLDREGKIHQPRIA